uniref:Uncharacterized protein n=1 Tax=Pundamilia nyererei TaxID=303518 RepID=A0A3B4G2C5_9CICH
MNMIQRKMLLTLGAMGFQPAPKITFIHDESKHLPIAHTWKEHFPVPLWKSEAFLGNHPRTRQR